MKVVAIIPARGGSKAIPRKNLVRFCGRPLLEWSILQALAAKSVDEVFVTSDDDETLRISERAGATPIRRPAHLSTDSASSESALLHTLDWIEQRDGAPPGCVVFLQATSPLREPSDIDGAVEAMRSEEADSLFSASELEDSCIWKKTPDGYEAVTFDPNSRGRRQDREPLLLENGSIYVFEAQGFRARGNRLGERMSVFGMASWKSWEIDSTEDLALCSYYFRRHRLDLVSEGPGRGLSASDIDLVVFDFDGVMTDNRAWVTQDGVESVVVNRGDGLGVDGLRSRGIPMLILSTERNEVVAARGRKLQIEVVQGCGDKASALSDLCVSRGIPLSRVLFVGNDVNDLSALRIVGYPVAPADAHPEVLLEARIVTQAAGGEGVVREVADLINP